MNFSMPENFLKVLKRGDRRKYSGSKRDHSVDHPGSHDEQGEKDSYDFRNKGKSLFVNLGRCLKN